MASVKNVEVGSLRLVLAASRAVDDLRDPLLALSQGSAIPVVRRGGRAVMRARSGDKDEYSEPGWWTRGARSPLGVCRSEATKDHGPRAAMAKAIQ
jgi:hypothetical protein